MSSGKSQSDRKPEDKKSGLTVCTGSNKICHICEKEGHTTITTARGNVIIPYYVCEKFVKMSIPERLAVMVSKNLCTVCLFPGAVAGPQHKCSYTNFCCPSHSKNDKIHILLCEKHILIHIKIEYHDGNKDIAIETNMKQTVYIYKCVNKYM